eukprot:5545464-Amphidinium_carterae.1
MALTMKFSLAETSEMQFFFSGSFVPPPLCLSTDQVPRRNRSPLRHPAADSCSPYGGSPLSSCMALPAADQLQ